MRTWSKCLGFALFLLGFAVCGVWGFGTAMTFLWPGYLLIALSAVLCSLGRLSQHSIEKTAAGPLPTFCLIAGALLAGYILVRGYLSPVAYLAREDLSLAAVWFSVWSLITIRFTGSKARTAIFLVLVILVAINLSLVLWQVRIDPSAWVLPGYSRISTDRVGGIFNNPNHLAGFLAAVIPMIFSFALWGRSGAHRRLLLTFLGILALLALALTKSRGGLIATFAGLGTLAALALWLYRSVWVQRKGIALAALAFLLISGGSLAAFNFGILEKRFGSGAFSHVMEVNRPLMWEAALKQNSEAHVFGTGSRTYYYYSRQFRSPAMHVSTMESDFAHNEWLQMAADYGWAGFGLLIVFVFAHAINGLKFIRKRSADFDSGKRHHLQSRQLAFTAGAISGLVALGAHAAVDFLLHVPAVSLVGAIFLGALASPGHRKRRSAPIPKTGGAFSIFWKTATPAMAALLLFFGSSFVRSEWHVERAKRLFASDTTDLRIFGHLRNARELDPANPFAHSLSGHIHLYAMDHSMPKVVLDAWLKKARDHFESALENYPADIYAMLGLAGCLDALGEWERAGEILARAREAAPLYGNIMLAQGVHCLKIGDLDRAEAFFSQAHDAPAFRDWRAAGRGLSQIATARESLSRMIPEAIAGGN